MEDRAQALQQMEAEKERFLTELKSWTVEERSYHPEGGWNALQIMEHIITSEVGTLGYLKKKTQASADDIPAVDAESTANGVGLVSALKSDRQWQAPNVLQGPTGMHSFDALSAHWETVREDFFGFIDDLSMKYDHRQVFNHPIAGRIGLFHTLGFLATHITHHMHQLERVKKAMKANA